MGVNMGIWDDYKEDLTEREGPAAEEIFITLFGEAWQHDTPNAKLFTDLYNWYTSGAEDGMYQFFEFEPRTEESLAELGAVIEKYFPAEAYAVFQRSVNELMPLVYADEPDDEAIDALSVEIDDYFNEHQTELLHSIKEYLLAEGDSIAEEIGW